MRKFYPHILSFNTKDRGRRPLLRRLLKSLDSLTSATCVFICAITTIGFPALAQDKNSSKVDGELVLVQILSRSLPINQAILDFYESPGDIRYQDSLSLSEAYLSMRQDKSEMAVHPQNGSGQAAVDIGAKSFLHIDSRQCVWGNAHFSTGSYKDIKWCNSLDYEGIAPYVLGDEVGGDLSFRQYLFGGGYNRLYDNGVSIGASLFYRAEIAWRDRDPRLRTIVSDIEFTLGTSYRYNKNRVIGVSASVESYTQNSDLEFYNPLNQINTLPLTGLGSYNKRFAGNTNKNSGHSGLGYLIGCHIGSVEPCHSALQFQFWFKGVRMNQLLRNFNNITLAYTQTYTTHMSIAFPLDLSQRIRIMPEVEGEYFHRLGTENLFGTASGASYDKIGSRSPYLNQSVKLNLSIPIEFNLSEESSSTSSSSTSSSSTIYASKTYLTLEPSGRYQSIIEELTSVGRKIQVGTISPEISLCLNRLSGRWFFEIRGKYGWTNCLKDLWEFPGFDMSSSVQESVASTFKMLSSSNSTLGAGLSITRRIGKMAVGVHASYSYRNYSISTSDPVSRGDSQKAKYHDDNLDISLKINF